MPRVVFEPTIPVFERAETVHAIDHAAIVIGRLLYTKPKMSFIRFLKKIAELEGVYNAYHEASISL
jgi:hypothetical protein